jgi:hypothetical protein
VELLPMPNPVLKAMSSTTHPIPNFTVINKKLSTRIDRNWRSRFVWLQWEICKSRWYLDALANGVSVTPRIERPLESNKKSRFSFMARRRTSAGVRRPVPIFGGNAPTATLAATGEDDVLEDDPHQSATRFDRWLCLTLAEGCDGVVT